MRTNDELLQEVYRRARVLRIRKIRRRKRLLGMGCFALSFLLLFLLSGKSDMTVASSLESYGSLVFEGSGVTYVVIAVVFFLLGIPAGLGLDLLMKRWKQRRIARYAKKWIAGKLPEEDFHS